jgi:hypothetical protein
MAFVATRQTILIFSFDPTPPHILPFHPIEMPYCVLQYERSKHDHYLGKHDYYLGRVLGQLQKLLTSSSHESNLDTSKSTINDKTALQLTTLLIQ